MCEKLVQEYRVWLSEILKLLELVCEDVVPAGRPDRDLHWKTKELWEKVEQLGQEGRSEQLESILLQYERDGKALLEQVKASTDAILVKNVSLAKAEGSLGRNASEEPGELPEEFRIALRREYAGNILSSLQMLVNLNYLAEEHLKCGLGKISEIFEVDTLDGVKRVRSGVIVTGKCNVSILPKLPGNRYETSGVRVFRISAVS